MRQPDKKTLQNLALQTEAAEKNKGTPRVAIGLDVGEKFWGLAWSPDGTVVLPLEVVPANEGVEALERVRKKTEETKPLLIVGLPVSDDGSESSWCTKVRTVAKKLAGTFDVQLVNERFSSQESLGQKGKRNDDLAAAKILEYGLRQRRLGGKRLFPPH